MKLTNAISSLTLAVSYALAVTIAYDNTYDNAAASLSTVVCSNGPNGLLTKGFTTFGSLPHFPNIGSAQAIAGWNSASCGTCWTLTFNDTAINVLAIDHAGAGFTIAQAALDKLTHNQAVALGRIDATATSAPASACGL